MTYRRSNNRHKAWQNYCQQHAALIDKLELPNWVFASEPNFRRFATMGQLGAVSSSVYCFGQLEDSLFWDLFHFIQTYFDMDATLFDAFERARIRR